MEVLDEADEITMARAPKKFCCVKKSTNSHDVKYKGRKTIMASRVRGEAAISALRHCAVATLRVSIASSSWRRVSAPSFGAAWCGAR